MRTSPAFHPSRTLGLVVAALLGACATPGYDQPPPAANGSKSGSKAERDADAVAALAARAQDRDYSVGALFEENHGEVLRRSRRFQPDLEVAFMHEPDIGLKGEPGDFNINSLRGDLAWEMPVDPDSWLKVGLHGKGRKYEATPDIAGADADETLWETGAILGGGKFMSPSTFLEGQFEPGLYSDLDGTLHSEDWQFFGHLRATFQSDDNLYWRVGVRVDNTFEDIPVYPQLGLAWQFAENWRLDVLAPNYLEITWNPSTSLLLDFGVEVTGNEYEVRSPPAAGKGRFTWQTQELRVYTRATWRFTDLMSMFVRGGGTFAGDYEFRGTGGLTDGSNEGSLFVEGGLGFSW